MVVKDVGVDIEVILELQTGTNTMSLFASTVLGGMIVGIGQSK